MHHPHMLRHQQGVALLTILLMVVTATILAVGLLTRQDRMMRETSVLLRQDQSLKYALAGENLFGALLIASAQDNANVDSARSIWAKPIPPYPVEDGAITGKLIDQSGKFNLNNLYHNGQTDAVALAYFKRLLTRLGLQTSLASAVLDWQTSETASPVDSDGAKNSFYLGQTPPYQAANRPFQQIEELRKVRGFDEKSYQLLAPYVSALPQFAPININTASAPVLEALDDSLTPASVNAWIIERNASANGMTQVSALWQDSVFSKVPANSQSTLATLLDVKSSYFQSQIDVNLSGRDRFLTSDIYRVGQKVYVWRRSLAPFQVVAPVAAS
ncbi:MAG: type II secretion system minor pseudopilin GspK [Gammaproteobacteria bacterium]|nr:type II secretion system minor pseudopilin GspK [Gammaproteobacteria bacterium]